MRIPFAFILLLAVWPALAKALTLDGPMTQGGLIRGQTEAGAKVTLDGRPLRVNGDGVFIFGFGWDFAGPANLTVRLPDGTTVERSLEVTKRTYREQRIDGLPKKMVTPPQEVLARIARENAAIKAVRMHDSDTAWFTGGFDWPVKGPISGVFGSRRILNGEPRRPHFGVDVAAAPGTPVAAPADGTVALAEADLYFTGGTVMIDHGHGLTSVYSHLQDVTAKVGDVLRRGDIIGTVGATGRATGPHLDWRINWFEQRLDPALLVGPMPK